MEYNDLSEPNSKIVYPSASVSINDYSTSNRCISDKLPIFNASVASCGRVRKRAYCPVPFESFRKSNQFVPHVSVGDFVSEYVSPCNVGNHMEGNTTMDFNHFHLSTKRPCLKTDKHCQYIRALEPSTKLCSSSTYISPGNSKLSLDVSGRSYFLDDIHWNDSLSIQFPTGIDFTKLTMLSEAPVTAAPNFLKSVCPTIPNTDTTRLVSSRCDNYKSTSSSTLPKTIVKMSRNSVLSSENSKDVNQFENGTQCNSKATVFKHEPRKRKSQNHNGATIVLMNSTCQASSSSLFSNVSNDVTSKSDAKSTLSFNQESRSVFTSTTTAPIQLLLPSHNLVTHVATSTLNRSKCKVNRASVSSDTVRKSIGVALRPILPNHLRKYPNTLLLNTRLGLKSICDTATIQSIHHIRPDFKRIPNHNNSFTQDHRQNIAFALCESSDEDRNIDLISKNKLSVFKSSIIASKSDNTITSTNAPSVIIPSPVIDILPYNSPSQFIAANLTYMNTVFYSSPEEDFLWESQFFGKKDGRQLIYTIIYLFAKLLNLRKSHQLHQLNSGSNSQLQLIYFDDNHNDDEVRDSSIKMANSHPTLNSDLQNLSNIYMIGKDRNSSLIYRPDPSCFTLPNSSVTTSRMPSSTTATVTNMSDQKSHSYFDYLDENSPQDYTMKQNAKLHNIISCYNSISSFLSNRKERKLLTSPGFNFILDHNAVKNHERCIVCYHEFYMSKRQSSTDQSFESKYFLTWRTNCATRSLWFSCYPIGPTQLATILRKIEFTLAHTAVRIQQQKQHTINLSSIDLPLNQNLIKSTSSMLSRVKNELNFNLCSGSNTPLDLVMRNSENETGNTNSANDWILEKANGERQTDTSGDFG